MLGNFGKQVVKGAAKCVQVGHVLEQINSQIARCCASTLSHPHRSFHSTHPLDNVSPEKQYVQAQERNKEAGPMLELVRDFLDPAEMYKAMRNIGVDFFCGVPDSLLKDICCYITAHTPEHQHVITANEGSAVALAAGYHLATGKFGLVYLQNSGLGNIVNPIMSMACPGVYSIPMLLLVGWRGEPGKRDEPQHMVQGQATPNMLASMGIPVQPLPDYQDGAEKALITAKQHMETAGGPYCLLVKRQTFSPFKLNSPDSQWPLTREDAIKVIVDSLGPYDVTVGTTGQTSRELFEYRVEKSHSHEKDFLTVGSMGHASCIAMGIAMHKPSRQVFCIDGDGAAIMHMGTFAQIGTRGPSNLKHILINNGAHDSVGGQPSAACDEKFSFSGIALSCGYKHAMVASEPEEIRESVKQMREIDGPVLLEIKTQIGSRPDLGRPTRTPIQNKTDLMEFLKY